MFRLTNVLHAGAGALELQNLTANAKGSTQRRISAADLVDFGLCPHRWVTAPDPEDPLVAFGPPLPEWLAWAPTIGQNFFAARPATYEARVLKCPNCGSKGPAASCTKCGLRRQNTLVVRNWSTGANYCQQWEEQKQALGLRVLSARTWESARLGADKLNGDPHVHALMAAGSPSQMLLGTYTDPINGLVVPLWAWASFLPEAEGPKGQLVGRVLETANADPAQWERSVLGRGLHLEAALTMSLLNSEPSNNRSKYVWAVLEKAEPRLLARRLLSNEGLTEGHTRLQELLATYAQACAAGTWPNFERVGADFQDAWRTADIADWLTGGAGDHGGYLAPDLVEQGV